MTAQHHITASIGSDPCNTMAGENELNDGDYVLKEGAGWFDVKGFVIRVHTTDEGVFVDIYDKRIAATGSFDAALLGAACVFDSELQDDGVSDPEKEGDDGTEPHDTEDRNPSRGFNKTQNQYVAEGGALCPSCNSSHVQAQDLQMDGGQAWSECTCNACDSSWTDQYKLFAYNPTGMVDGNTQDGPAQKAIITTAKEANGLDILESGK